MKALYGVQFLKITCCVKMQMFASYVLCIFVMFNFGAAMPEEKDGVLEKIKAGLQYATNYIETAKDIADLVSKSLNHKVKGKKGEESNDKGQSDFGPSNIVSAFFRLLGLDSQKVTAIAVNSVIFLAQMISSLFGLNPPKDDIGRHLEDNNPESLWNPAKFILESKNERIQNLIEQAQDETLPSQLIKRMDGFDSGCIRLLLCKTSPIITAAQNSLRNKSENNSRHMTSWFPKKDVFETNSDECENKYNDCNLFPES